MTAFKNRSIEILVLLISLLAVRSLGYPEDITTGHSVRDAVRKMGSDEQDRARINLLAQNPAQAARLLVKELRPVGAAHIVREDFRKPKYADAMHVIWCLRALRCLTGGKDFRAPTTHRFGSSEVEQNRKQFLGLDEYSTVKFFGTWMSRDSIFIAPQDAQRGIIAQWRRWFENEGETFDYPRLGKDLNDDAWYF